MLQQNRWVETAVKDLVKASETNGQLIVLGSTALFAHCKDYRPIHDVDSVFLGAEMESVADNLLRLGWQKVQVINPNYPFHRQLEKEAGKRYFRFEKNNHLIDLLASLSNKGSGNQLNVELYPGVTLSFPSAGTTRQIKFGNAEFTGLSPEALLSVRLLFKKTWGRIYKDKTSQRERETDINLKLVNPEALKHLKENTFLFLGPIRLKDWWTPTL